MLFRLAKAEYDHHTERGYVEFRGNDGDGGEIVIATIVSFRSKSKLSKQQLQLEIHKTSTICAGGRTGRCREAFS